MIDIMYTIGVNAFHGDASACIYRDTTLVAAIEEERIVRVKHWAGFPIEAIKFCLSEAGIGIEQVDVIAMSRDPWAKSAQKFKYAIRNAASLSMVARRAGHVGNVKRVREHIATGLGVSSKSIRAKVDYVEHHLCHIASAFYTSPFEDAACLSIDGMGDFSSTMKGIGRGNSIEILDSTSFPTSLGFFYTALTQYLGFPHYGDEYKVMGLAPYGKPVHVDRLRDVIKLEDGGQYDLNAKYFRDFSKDNWVGSDSKGRPVVKELFGLKLIEEFGEPRQEGRLEQYHFDLAASVQRITEEAIFHIVEDLVQTTGIADLCLAGGVGQNSVANGKIVSNTSVENLYVPPAAHDGGTSVGAALASISKRTRVRVPYVPQPYTGPEFSDQYIEQFLSTVEVPGSVRHLDEGALVEYVSEKLVHGAVVGWFQGRAEFGPRALGNRSILVDPRRADAKRLLNEKIKKRESFRPFAPSILQEHVCDYFETHDEAPFMEKVFLIREGKRDCIPAVTHVDGTGRLQTVRDDVNPRYHALISAFYRRTGVPILLNTSFNENEPIVNTPEHALACYARTQMDLLVLGGWVIERKEAAS